MPFSSICLDEHVKVWLDKMRKHEPSLHRHSLRVGQLANDYYRFCGVEYTRGWDFVEGALLHDLGKICLPASILTKPTRLDEAEKRMIALHPVIGAELLEAQDHFSKPVINIVRRHHERLDGSGYPDGWRLKRTAKVVRVVAACDAFCAMTEERPYEEAWPWEEVVERLQSMPNQYDLAVVRSLQAMIQDRGTSIHLRGEMPRTSRSGLTRRAASAVKRPKSAFYAPRPRSRS